jgi:hypothetical protein
LIHKRFLSSRCHVLPGELSTWPSFLPRMQQVHGKSTATEGILASKRLFSPPRATLTWRGFAKNHEH